MRIFLYILAVPVVLVILAVLLVPLFLDKARILELAAEQVHRQTGADLQVNGEVDLSLFPTLGVSLGDITLTMPEPAQSSLAARALVIGVQVMPLLSGEVAIDTLALDGLVARLTTDPAPAPVDTTRLSAEELQGFYAKRQAAREAAGRSAGERAALAVPLALNVASLAVTDSRIESTEAGGDTQVILINRLAASDLNLDGRPIPLQADIRLEGESPIDVALAGDVTVDQASQLIGLQDITVEVGGVGTAPIKLQTSGQVDISREVADLDLVAALPDATARGQLRYASFESPQIDAQLHLDRFTPALLALAGPEAAQTESQPDPAPTDTEGADTPLPVDAIRRMDTRARLTIDQVIWDGHTIDGLEARLRVVDGAALLHQVTGRIHGGQLAMKANLNAKQPEARVNTEGSLKGVDIAAVLAAADSQPVLTGTADLDWKLNGRGNSTAALTETFKGPITLVTSNAVLREMGVEKMMCEAVALVNQESLSSTFPTETAFKALSADVNLAGGKALLQPLRADLGNMRLNGTGGLTLTSMDFEATFKARVTPELAELDPACRINERITGIDWPVNCRGNIGGEPGDWCSVDTAAIVAELTTNELKRKAQKEVERKFGEGAGDALKKLLGN